MVVALASLLDDRFSAAFTGDDKFQLGDMTKRAVMGTILDFTGKETYESGDIERAVNESDQEDGLNETSPVNKIIEIRVDPEFEEWDDAFRDSHPEADLALTKSLITATAEDSMNEWTPKSLDMEIASELEQWDKIFQEKYPEVG